MVAPEPHMDVDAEKIRQLIAHAGRPYTLVNFFATWCKPCEREMPDLVALHKDPNSEISVLLVSIDRPADAKSKLRNFLGDFGVDFATYARSRGEATLIKRFDPYWDGRIPLSILYSREGKQLEVFRGLTDRAEIELIVNKNKKLGS